MLTFFSTQPPPPRPTPFPYTTLFRSRRLPRPTGMQSPQPPRLHASPESFPLASVPQAQTPAPSKPRSEEHTSELQSPDQLVCRLLLEKKKQRDSVTPTRTNNDTNQPE